eukprot:CAMPEP_0169272466 /NCGR_PEP_ID=MMETSP1016-20121227/50468_1 /TAXON_ID=342587 /ORGANISM="Karlodinium micrum, Strain CCMP2283" /LENGTH=58 /DNA_ID=CAMNT_0009358485 /DNA_START=345 /DNA_END=521 /DNA_ORIENTATION=-
MTMSARTDSSGVFDIDDNPSTSIAICDAMYSRQLTTVGAETFIANTSRRSLRAEMTTF